MTLALATMLLPVAAVAAAGLVTFRLSISALEEFRREIVEESDPATGKQFVALSALIDRRPAPPDELAAMLRTVDPTEVTVAARLARLT